MKATNPTVRQVLLGIIAAPLFSAGIAHAADEEDTTKRCLPLRNISRIEVVDSQHLVFHLNNRERYLNTLPHKCPGLGKHDPIMYKTSLTSLCDLDTITVLHDFGGGLQPGATCGLGKFELQPELE